MHLDRAAHRVDDADELDQESIAGGLDDAPAVLLDLGTGELAPQRPQSREGAFLSARISPRE